MLGAKDDKKPYGVNVIRKTTKTIILKSKDTLGFPPKIISVPLPAMFVDMVMPYFRPAWAIISASLAAYCKNVKECVSNILKYDRNKFSMRNTLKDRHDQSTFGLALRTL